MRTTAIATVAVTITTGAIAGTGPATEGALE
jgi:hypothetical protein